MCESSDAGQILSIIEPSQSLIMLDLISGVCSSWHTHRSQPDVGGGGSDCTKPPGVVDQHSAPVLGAKVGNATVSLGDIYSPPPTQDPSQMSILSSLHPHRYYSKRPLGLAAWKMFQSPTFPPAGRPVLRRGSSFSSSAPPKETHSKFLPRHTLEMINLSD